MWRRPKICSAWRTLCARQISRRFATVESPPSATGWMWSSSSFHRLPQRRPSLLLQEQHPLSRAQTSRRTAAGIVRAVDGARGTPPGGALLVRVVLGGGSPGGVVLGEAVPVKAVLGGAVPFAAPFGGAVLALPALRSDASGDPGAFGDSIVFGDPVARKRASRRPAPPGIA
jgi:hypothetical protein